MGAPEECQGWPIPINIADRLLFAEYKRKHRSIGLFIHLLDKITKVSGHAKDDSAQTSEDLRDEPNTISLPEYKKVRYARFSRITLSRNNYQELHRRGKNT